MNTFNQLTNINKVLQKYKIDCKIKTKKDLILLFRRLGARNPEEADIFPDFRDVVKVILPEELSFFSEQFLSRFGIVFDAEKGVFVDTQEGREYEEYDTAWGIILQDFFLDDFENFLKKENEEDFQEYVQKWRDSVAQEIFQTSEFMEFVAREAEDMFGLSYVEVLNNLRTNGVIGAKLRNYILEINDEILEFQDPETDEWLVKKALAVSHYRHTMTDYDRIDKSMMDEFAVDELRKQKNREMAKGENI